MKFKKYITSMLLIAIGVVTLASCSKDDFTDTIFPDGGSELDPSSYSYKFDKWLKLNYTDTYNLDFRYKMQDVGADMNYNLVPAEFDKAQDLALLTRYLWFDVYKKIVGPDFLKMYGPRIIHLIGSSAYNPQSGTEILGLAEGGIKVTLFKVNNMDLTNVDMMNEYYFKTMHHEFTHILHQTKTYPKEFNLLSQGHYDSSNWQDRNIGVVNSLGYVTTYASSETREDFAETVANYIVKTDAQWNQILDYAGRGWMASDPTADKPEYYCWYYYKNNDPSTSKVFDLSGYSLDWPYDNCVTTTVDASGNKTYTLTGAKDDKGNPIIVYAAEDTDKVDGVSVINQKVNIARNWFKEAWNADLDALRKEVQERQANIDIQSLREEISNIK